MHIDKYQVLTKGICRTRRVKCDEGKPNCARYLYLECAYVESDKLTNAGWDLCSCTRTNRTCGGYRTPDTSSRELMPKPVLPGLAVGFPEPQALEFFFLKTAPQLAGFFGGSFFTGSVLQRSLSESAICQAIGAIGYLHEKSATRKLSPDSGLHVQLYNCSIRSILKASTGPNAISVVAMANILFTCLEIFQGNIDAAAQHARSGIHLFNAWREQTRPPGRLWGRKYSTPESRFMETEIAPILSIFNLRVLECGTKHRVRLILNPVDQSGNLRIANRFESLEEANVALTDMITAATWQCDIHNSDEGHRTDVHLEAFATSQTVQGNIDQWSSAIDDLVGRQARMWSKKEHGVANALGIIKLSTKFGLLASNLELECGWDAYREDYEELVHFIEAILSDKDRFPDDLSRSMSLDCGYIFALHAGAWKCRWPKLRRRCLGLLLEIPQRDFSFEARHYHQIFSRICELEEGHIGPPTTEPDDDWLPPEESRIHDFEVAAEPRILKGSIMHAVTFWSKPQGPDGPWHSSTELMILESSHATNYSIPSNFLGRRVP